nr:hypothetical protein CFP56_43240 [Quercus suber]
MATRYSKDKYARIKNLKNKPLANLTFDSRKRKLNDDKDDAVVPTPSVHTASPSPTPSLEVTAATPPLTRARGKSKVGMSVWDDIATTLGCAHNVITNDELKGLSSIPSHELVSRNICKLVQVLGESLRITTDYLNVEEKVVMATSKAESVEDSWPPRHADCGCVNDARHCCPLGELGVSTPHFVSSALIHSLLELESVEPSPQDWEFVLVQNP